MRLRIIGGWALSFLLVAANDVAADPARYFSVERRVSNVREIHHPNDRF